MKYAFLIDSSLEEPAPLTNTLEYARKLDDAGHDVVVFFDGEATQWIPELEGDEDRLADEVYADVRDRGLVGGRVASVPPFSRPTGRSRRRQSPWMGGRPNTVPTSASWPNRAISCLPSADRRRSPSLSAVDRHRSSIVIGRS